MSTHGLPNDILSNLDPLALIIFIPIFDLIVRYLSRFFYLHFTLIMFHAQIYPGLRRLGVNFSALKKITGGFAAGEF